MTSTKAALLTLSLCVAVLVAASLLHAAPAVVQSSAFSAARVYPNPWRADRHADSQVMFSGLTPQAQVKIFTISGYEVRSLVADAGGSAPWNRMNGDGKAVASGIYLYLVTDGHGDKAIGKLAIIR